MPDGRGAPPLRRRLRPSMNGVLALLAGLLLFASDHPLGWWPLQFVAFAPLWVAFARQRAAGALLWPLGGLFATGSALPTCAAAGMAPPIVAAMLANVVQWLLLASVCGRLVDRGPIRGALAAASAVALAEIAVWHAVPVFGTAQCFARPLSAAPSGVAFLAFTGMAGLVFALTAVQALLANALCERRRGPLLTAGAILGVVAALDVARWTRPLGASLRVATFGWGGDGPAPRGTAGLAALDAAFAEAAAAGAHLLVTPETGRAVRGSGIADACLPRDALLGRLAERSRAHGLAAAIGVWHGPTADNRSWLIAKDGELRGEYRKTHLVPWLEDYAAGDGTLARFDVAGAGVGTMICQDDNFTDVARAYGRERVRLMAVPTNDWATIREFHLENALFRAIENGYAVARATSNGVSAIVSPRGEALARFDHTEGGRRLLVADVPVGDGEPTLYARFGDWPMAALCALLLAAALPRRRGVSPPADAPAAPA